MKRSNETTERLFREAGISKGMYVLELGCGPGEVTEIVAKIVGPSGSVLAVDHSKEMPASVRTRLNESGLENVRFVRADISSPVDYLVPRKEAKWMRNSGLYSTTHVRASLDGQPKTVAFLDEQFKVNLRDLVK